MAENPQIDMPKGGDDPDLFSRANEDVGQGGYFSTLLGFLQNRTFVYIVRRIIVLIPLWLGISILTFGMVRAIGSPADIVQGSGRQRLQTVALIERQFGLNEPLYLQYVNWLTDFTSWRFGYSGYFKLNDSTDAIENLIWQTAKLQYVAIFLAIAISIPLGIIAARNRATPTDTTVSAFALMGLSMPIYLTGYLLIKTFGPGGFGILPGGGTQTAFRNEVTFSIWIRNFFDFTHEQWGLLFSTILDSLSHMVLPLIALTFFQLALITRLVRSSMLEVLRQDYILAARANGLSERTIIWKLSLRNAILPAITFIAISLGTALAGAPITETVFSWEGLGLVYVQAIFLIDMTIILGITMIITTLILLSNLAADIIYVMVDPRISL